MSDDRPRRADMPNNSSLPIVEATYLVVDFETLTPKGRPPEPIELGARRIGPSLEIDRRRSWSWLIKPPPGVPVTPFDTMQTGIKREDLESCPSAEVVFETFESVLEMEESVLVAHNAQYELSIFSRFSGRAPTALRYPFIDTVALARGALPNIPKHNLDSLANYFDLRLPPGRHRALADVDLTAEIFIRLLGFPKSRRVYATVGDLILHTGVEIQGSLF
jgi:DNA polymerase-3 subunit epsilon